MGVQAARHTPTHNLTQHAHGHLRATGPMQVDTQKQHIVLQASKRSEVRQKPGREGAQSVVIQVAVCLGRRRAYGENESRQNLLVSAK